MVKGDSVGDLAERVRELVRETCEAFEIRIVKGVVKDHIHILVSCPPEMAPSEIMRRIKGRTSSKLFEEFPHVKKRYWGRTKDASFRRRVSGLSVRDTNPPALAGGC